MLNWYFEEPDYSQSKLGSIEIILVVSNYLYMYQTI